jgi:hypothetical protein
MSSAKNSATIINYKATWAKENLAQAKNKTKKDFI